MSGKIFVAGPLGFTLPGRTFLTRTLHPALVGNGFSVLDQWAQDEVDPEMLAAENVRMLLEANAVLAVLDGPDVDSGTAAEIGFASAAGTPIVGYRSSRAGARDPKAGINIQVLHLINRSGGSVVSDLDDLILMLEAVTRL